MTFALDYNHKTTDLGLHGKFHLKYIFKLYKHIVVSTENAESSNLNNWLRVSYI